MNLEQGSHSWLLDRFVLAVNQKGDADRNHHRDEKNDEKRDLGTHFAYPPNRAPLIPAPSVCQYARLAVVDDC